MRRNIALRAVLSFYWISLFVLPAFASGPVYPDGWRCPTKMDPTSPQVAHVADLNGSGLTGGLFVLENPQTHIFAFFALTYSSSQKARWQLLETHPIAKLDQFTFAAQRDTSSANGLIIVTGCIEGSCNQYRAKSKGDLLTRFSQ